jgi:hypothetical protein
MERFCEARRFNTVEELTAILNDLVTCPVYGKSIGLAGVEVLSPDDRDTPPFVTDCEIWEETFSDKSTAFNLRIVCHEADGQASHA